MSETEHASDQTRFKVLKLLHASDKTGITADECSGTGIAAAFLLFEVLSVKSTPRKENFSSF